MRNQNGNVENQRRVLLGIVCGMLWNIALTLYMSSDTMAEAKMKQAVISTLASAYLFFAVLLNFDVRSKSFGLGVLIMGSLQQLFYMANRDPAAHARPASSFGLS